MMYTILAYKPNSDDYCMGCVMGRYDSAFEFISTEDRAEVVKFLVDKMKQNENLDTNEAEYGLTILINGIDSDENVWNEEKQEYDYSIEAEAKAIMSEATELAAGAMAAAKLVKEVAKAQQAAEAADREAREKELADAKEYTRLRAKFEGGN